MFVFLLPVVTSAVHVATSVVVVVVVIVVVVNQFCYQIEVVEMLQQHRRVNVTGAGDLGRVEVCGGCGGGGGSGDGGG